MVQEKLIEKAKNHCLKVLLKKKDRICVYLPGHIISVQKWAEKMIKKYPGVDKEVLLLSIWLHDIGHATAGHMDHNIGSEKETRSFLKRIKVKNEEIEKVAHCVRAHRCKDIKPETIEAKILAFADSASHMIDGCYVDMLMEGKKELAIEKLERDYRDVGIFPEMKKEIKPLYEAWKQLLRVYPDK
ncbi:MAG: HD domain-containing protein [Candidatus Nealsonbacteria bacterium]